LHRRNEHEKPDEKRARASELLRWSRGDSVCEYEERHGADRSLSEHDRAVEYVRPENDPPDEESGRLLPSSDGQAGLPEHSRREEQPSRRPPRGRKGNASK